MSQELSRMNGINSILDDAEAKAALERFINEKHWIGKDVEAAVEVFKSMKFSCDILDKFPEFYYCTSNVKAPDLPGFYVAREWKILLYFDQSNTLTKVEVNIGRTGI